MAATIALMAFESADYAKSLDDIEDKIIDIDSVEGLYDEKLNKILALVAPDQYDFGSGPWFITTQCDTSVRTQLDENIDTGFDAYMGYIGTALTDRRITFLTRAKDTFSI